eukprot:8183822-Pyramimonas_sp.AAC.1
MIARARMCALGAFCMFLDRKAAMLDWKFQCPLNDKKLCWLGGWRWHLAATSSILTFTCVSVALSG